MTILIVVAVIAIILFFPVSLQIRFDGEFGLYVCILFFKFRLFKQSKKEKKKKIKSDKPVKTDTESLLSKLSRLIGIVRNVIKNMHYAAFIKRFDVSIKVATGDPCSTALAYGAVNTAIYSLIAIVEKGFRIKKQNIVLNADYNSETTEAYFNVMITTFLLRLLVFLIFFASETINNTSNEEN